MDKAVNPFDEMTDDEFFTMIRESISDEKRQQNYDELHREHVMIINPSKKKQLEKLVKMIDKFFNGEYYEINYSSNTTMPQHLRIGILCHEFGFSKEDLFEFAETMQATTGITISDSGYEDKVSVSMIIKDFFSEIK